MKLYSYYSCSTCRRAINWLENNYLAFELIDLLKSPPSREMLVSACEVYGDRKYLLNTSGVAYRSIGPNVVKKMTDNEFFEQLFIEPRLIKRPFLYISCDSYLIGFKDGKWAEKLL